MSISKSKILGSFIEYPLPENIITKEALNLAEILFSKESLHPSVTNEKIEITKVYSPSSDNWRGQYYNSNNNNKNEFKRGHSFQHKEDLININIENLYSFNDITNFPKDKESFYLKDNNYGNITGPFSSDNLMEMYIEKKIDSSYSFRPIDIYSFKELPLFSFQPLSTINDKDWSYKLMDNPLLQYTELFKTTQKLLEFPSKKNIEKKSEEKVKSENIKKEDIKKEDLKEEIIEKKVSNIKEDNEGEWEDPNRKKRKVRPQKKEKEEKQIPIGLQGGKNDIKINSANTIIKNNPENTQVSSDELLEMLRPKNRIQKEEKPLNIEDYYDDQEEVKERSQGAKKNKKKKRPHQANNNINLGFKY